MTTTRLGGYSGTVAIAVALLGACGGVIDLKTEATGGASGNGGEASAGESTTSAGTKTVEGGSPATGGTKSMAGGPSMGGSSTTGGSTSPGGATSTAGTDVGGTSSGGEATTGTAGSSFGPGSCTKAPGSKAGDGESKLIDALDDEDTAFVTAGVAEGSWFLDVSAFGEGTVSPSDSLGLVPIAGGHDGKALHVTGSGITGWGTGVGANLNGPGSAFDASKYGGIAFFIKGSTQVYEGKNRLMVLARMIDVVPGPDSCCDNDPAASINDCYSAHLAVIEVPATWQEVRIAWSDLVKPKWGYGMGLEFDPQRIRDIYFSFNHDTSPENDVPTSFDVWIDDLRFLGKGEASNVGGVVSPSGGGPGQ